MCYMSGSFCLLYLQLHLHLRHVTLNDVHNNNVESLRKCIMSDTVYLRNKEMQEVRYKKIEELRPTEYLPNCRHKER